MLAKNRKLHAKRPQWQHRLVERSIRRKFPFIASKLKYRYEIRSIGYGFKYEQKTITRTKSIIVYVKEKSDKPRYQRIPKFILLRTPIGVVHVSTDVIEVRANPKLSSAGSGQLLDAPPGSGTCAFFWREGLNTYAVTNDHVVRNLSNDTYVATININITGSRYNGEVVRSSITNKQNINEHDCAILKFNIRMPIGEWQAGGLKISKIGKPSDRHIYSYIASDGQIVQCQPSSEIQDIEYFDSTIYGVSIGYRGFRIMQVIGGRAAEGHSGALVTRQINSGEIIGVGLVFASHEQNNWAYVFDANREFRELDLSLPD